MTTMVILDFLSLHHLDAKKIKVNILSMCVTHRLGGTSADLLEDDTVSVYELLYGMMLPSGNDAAQALAIYFGHLQILINTKTGTSNSDANINLGEYEKPFEEEKEEVIIESNEDLEESKFNNNIDSLEELKVSLETGQSQNSAQKQEENIEEEKQFEASSK